MKIPFDSFEEARGDILKFGGSIEVLSPWALRLSVLDFARETTRVYEG
jgi:hypothetical protein